MKNIALIGPSNSGKTLMIHTIFSNKNRTSKTKGVDFSIYKHNAKNITFFDTDTNMHIITSTCNQCDIILLMYDASYVDPFSLVSYKNMIPKEKLSKTYLIANIKTSCVYPPEEASEFYNIKYDYVDAMDKDDVRELLNKIIPFRICCGYYI